MKEKIDFIISEIERLSPDLKVNWEVIFRYLVKLNSYLSRKELCNDKLVLSSIDRLLKIKGDEINTIINIYCSRIFYNRANKLESPLFIGDIMTKEIPDFVDRNLLGNKEKLFEKDPIFEEKNIIIRGGWLDLKDNKSFT